MIPLAVECPHCGIDLMDDEQLLDGQPSIRLRLLYRGEESALLLSSIYGSFRFKTEKEVTPGDETSIVCPSCRNSIVTDSACNICGAMFGRLRLAVGGDVFFCSRRGCKNHKVELVDLERSLIELTSYAMPE